MSNVHTVPAGTISAIAAAQTTHTEAPMPAVAAALETAGLSGTTRSSYFMSTDVARQVAWSISNNIGMLATRIQKLAQGKAGVADEAIPGETVRAEVRKLTAQLIWGYDNVGEHMQPLEMKVAEWCGGGYSRPAKPDDISQAAKFLGMSEEQMKLADEARRRNMQDYLTIRRAGLAPVMEAKIQSLLTASLEPIEPEESVIATACQRAFENRIMFGDWAGAALAKDDMLYHTGKAPTQPEVNNEYASKAARIREQLAEKQAEQALKDNAALIDFDPLSVAAA